MVKAFTSLPEKEMLALVDELKPDIQERMKIEMAPWVKGYTVDMDELYTELTLEKIDNKPSGPQKTKFTAFKLLFEDQLLVKQLQLIMMEKKEGDYMENLDGRRY